MKKGNIIINAKKGTDTVDIRLYGIISEWTDVNGRRLADEVSQYEGKYKKCNIYLNSNGGSVIEGIALFNILKRTKMEISIFVDGVAASMAFVLLQLPNAKRYMSKYTRIMAHRVSGGAYGNIDDLRTAADMMEGFEDDLINIISTRVGLSDEEVKAKWFDGKNYWFKPEEALENKLIDGIVDGNLSKDPENLNDVRDVINFYSEQITNYNQNFDTMDLTNIINSLGMPAGSDMAAVENKIAGTMKKVTDLQKENGDLKNEVAGYKTQIENQQKQAVKDLVDGAIASKKITEAQREVYTKLATNDFESTKTAIEAMAAPQSLDNFTGGAGGNSPIAEDRKNWTFQDWQKKDGKGLQNLKEKHPEVYDNLRNTAFPKE